MGIVKSRTHRLKFNSNPEINQPELNNPIMITTAVKAGSVLTLTFSQVVNLMRGKVPQFTTSVAGVTPVSAAQTAPNVIAITFSAAITAATTMNIPYHDPAIRNGNGGYVTSNTFPVT